MQPLVDVTGGSEENLELLPSPIFETFFYISSKSLKDYHFKLTKEEALSLGILARTADGASSIAPTFATAPITNVEKQRIYSLTYCCGENVFKGILPRVLHKIGNQLLPVIIDDSVGMYFK